MTSERGPCENYKQNICNEWEQENIIVPPKSICAPSMKQSKDRCTETDSLKECNTDYQVGFQYKN